MAKSIIEEALLEAEKLQESLKKNTKEILAATMRQEIDDIVKESFLSEQDEEEEVTDIEGTENEELENTEASEENEEEENADNEFEETEEESENEMSNDEIETPEMDVEISDLEVSDLDGMGDDESHELDLTNEPHEEVIKVFKKMSDEDEIEVVKDGKNVSLKDNKTGAEYQIQLDESDEAIYEIEMDEESEETEEDEIEENKQHIKYNRHSTFGNNMTTGGSKLEESYKTKINLLNEENKTLKTLVKEFESKQGEYKNALKIFRDKLNEIALFNTNLTYATKLFTEHSTTKQEKTNILKRFDSVIDLKESKSLYKAITDELVSKTPINESVDKKVNKTVSKGSVIKESTVYVDPQIKNIQNLMEKLDGRI